MDDAFHLTGNAGSDVFSGTGSVSAGELRFFQSSSQTLIQADLDGDGVADMEIALANTVSHRDVDFVL